MWIIWVNSCILPVRVEIDINLFDGKSKNYDANLYLLILNHACDILSENCMYKLVEGEECCLIYIFTNVYVY